MHKGAMDLTRSSASVSGSSLSGFFWDRSCPLSNDIPDRLGNEFWFIALNVVAALFRLAKLPVFRSASQAFLQKMKHNFRLFRRWIGSR